MSYNAQNIIQECQTTLQDLTGVRWPASELVVYLNDAQRDLILARPEANSVTSTLALTAGARQQLPAASMTLIDIIRNTSGNMRAIRKADMVMVDSVDRNWQSSAQATEIRNFMWDAREPNVFYTYPPAASGATVEVLYGGYPTAITGLTGDGKAYTTVPTSALSVNDQWVTALYNYIMSRSYAKDTEFGGNAALAMSYLNTFSVIIGVQEKASIAAAPQT